jgi:hypothetical protein
MLLCSEQGNDSVKFTKLIQETTFLLSFLFQRKAVTGHQKAFLKNKMYAYLAKLERGSSTPKLVETVPHPGKGWSNKTAQSELAYPHALFLGHCLMCETNFEFGQTYLAA